MKKGQATMEFLLTYGWAILMVLAAILALVYFDVLSPSNFVPMNQTVRMENLCVSHVQECADVMTCQWVNGSVI